MKRLLSIFLAVSLIFMSVFVTPIVANANTSGYYSYEIVNGKAIITECDGSIYGDVTIPSTLGGKPVAEIGYQAFYGCDNITKVTVNNGVTDIGEKAFHDCEKLHTIVLPNSVKIIKDSAFEGDESLKSINLPNGLKELGEGAFSSCDALETIILPGSLRDISDNTFYDCKKLKNITFQDGIENIGSQAFSSCTAIEEIYLPDSIKTVGGHAFYFCSNLENVRMSNNITELCNDDFGEVFNACDKLKMNSYGNAKYLGNEGNNYLCLLQYDDYKTAVNINPNTKIIANNALAYSSMEDITIPEGVRNIGSGAFENSDLKTVSLPNSIEHIGTDAFSGCKQLRYNSYDNAKYLGNSTNKYLYLVNTHFTTIDSCIINVNTKIIASGAFYSCDNLEKLVIPNGVIEIGRSAFAYCDKLATLTLSNKIKKICNKAFYNWSEHTLKTVIFCGTEQERKAIDIEEDNDELDKATWQYHIFSNGCDTSCNNCGYVRKTSHKYKTAWSSDGTNHWHECSVCKAKKDVTKHSTLITKNTKTATCKAKGYTGDKCCKICNRVITKGKSTALAAHKYKTTTKKSTYFATGKTVTKCSCCGKISKTKILKKLTLKVPGVSLTGSKKAIKVKVTKVTNQTGFQIRYRLKGTSKWTTKTYTEKSTATKTVNKLKDKKYYQVQTRSLVKSGSKTAYSSWSAAKTVKTK